MKLDSLIHMVCRKLKEGNQSETPQLYRVLCLFDNNYNTWYVCEYNIKLWHHKYPKGKYLFLDSIIEVDKFSRHTKILFLKIQMIGIYILF